MAWVERLVTRTSQPQDACGVDWSNPLTRRLVVATDSTGSLLTPLPVLASSEALRAPTPRGRLAKNSSASSNYTFRLSPTADDGLTFFAVIERNLKVYSDPNGGRIIQVSSVQFGGGYQSGLGLGSYANGLSLLFSIRRANYGGDASVSASVVESNGTEFQVVIGTYDIVNGARLFINGALVGTAPSSGQPIDRGFYDRLDTTGQALPGNLGGTYTSGILERALSISEVTEFSANPWQIFEPEVQCTWVPSDVSVSLPTLVRPSGTISAGAWEATAFGPDTVLNGNFLNWTGDNPNSWSVSPAETGASYVTQVGNSARIVSDGTNVGIYQPAQTQVGKTYKLTIVVDSCTGTLGIHANNGQIMLPISAPGEYSVTATLTHVGVGFKRVLACDATVSSFTCQEVLEPALHEAIDEELHEFADYISVNSASTAELQLAEAAFPGGANQTLAYWASSTNGSTLTVTLKQGETTILSRTHALTAADTLYTQTLTAPEIALITAGALSVTLTTS